MKISTQSIHEDRQPTRTITRHIFIVEVCQGVRGNVSETFALSNRLKVWAWLNEHAPIYYILYQVNKGSNMPGPQLKSYRSFAQAMVNANCYVFRCGDGPGSFLVNVTKYPLI